MIVFEEREQLEKESKSDYGQKLQESESGEQMTSPGGGFGGEQPPAGQVAQKGVFLSHASEDSHISQAFCNLIQDVSAGMIPTYSSSSKDQGAGIPYGDDWFTWIEARIRESGNVVALITPASIGRPWILFEAGFGRAIEGVRVFGLRLGTSGEDAYVGPFKAFQNSGSDRDDLLKLCKQLFEGTGCRPRDEMVLGQIDIFLASVDQHFQDQREVPTKVNPESEAFFRALGEMKALVQTKPSIQPDDLEDMRMMEIGHLFHMSLKQSRREVAPAVRATLLLGIACEVGLAWLVPTIQYALDHPVRIDKVLRLLLDEGILHPRRNRRLPFPPEILITELIRSVEETQRNRFRDNDDRKDDTLSIDGENNDQF